MTDILKKQFGRPAPLYPGDRVRIVSPSGCIDGDIVDTACRMLIDAGYEVIVGDYAKTEYCRFSGRREQRLSDLQKAFDDVETRAIFCSRGGYGATQLIGDVDFKKFCESPKWVVGYSDITAIHAMIQKNGFMSVHGPMLKHLTENGLYDMCIEHLFRILSGENVEYNCKAHKLNRNGVAKGTLRGGNMAVMNGLRGTAFDYAPEGTILFIEDIGERPYQIDRMLWNLKHGGVFDNISGLIVGSFTGYEDDLSMGATVYELIADMVADYDYPVCFGFPVGHTDDNEPLVCGSYVELSVADDGVCLK